MQRMRFIQVGVGGFGRLWTEVLTATADAELVGLVDVDSDALENAARRAELSEDACYQELPRALDEVEADAVVNVTPPAVHHGVATETFKRGLHMLTEKPLADDMDHARDMVRAADEAEVALMVSQNYRFRSWARTVRALLGEGKAGNPDNIAVRFASAPRFEESFRRSMEHPLVVDMSIHHFDLMRAVTGLEPERVYAETWQPSWSWFQHHPCCMAIFDFEGGMRACYDASWVTRGRQTSSNGYWRIECTESCVELLGDQVHVLQGPGPSRDAEVEMHDMPCENQAYSLLEFQTAIREDREPEASGRDNLRSLAMVYAVLESSRTGQPVNMDDV